MTRHVFLIGAYAIKFPRITGHSPFNGLIISFLEGWKANRYEYVWDRGNRLDFLCPVKASFLFSIILVMKRLEPISEEEFLSLDKFNFGGYEHKQDSIGKHNNKFYILDYGC